VSWGEWLTVGAWAGSCAGGVVPTDRYTLVMFRFLMGFAD
jgi:hypothetical protein